MNQKPAQRLVKKLHSKEVNQSKAEFPTGETPIIKASLFSSLKFLQPLVLILLSLVILAVVAGLVVVPKISRLINRSTPTDKEPPIVNPAGRGAFKYFPQGGSAPDFRDGNNGPLLLGFAEKDQQIIFDWPKEVKIGQVQVFDLGKVWNLADQKLVWQIQNYDPQNPPVGTNSAKNLSLINPPYTLGEKPDGFWVVEGDGQLQLSQGKRYSVELYGNNEKGLSTVGIFTFTYQKETGNI